ncbi:hypothetical protein OG883_31875 [Streptomyces sp. NBC_01142]|uniref:hypothetical protein n=1 Tax=Streptomyces sp. NBC_01142 TaxID=2975865 RepID=UPI0022509862|nr:hypothetical protein [Streptomyces sp. NBC_01142]MCX4824375.1 hypothetical protein [Streptomyces sp. NBC_01142]
MSTAVVAAGVVPAAAYSHSKSNTRRVSLGTLKVSFGDTWRGAGQKTWTIDSSKASASWKQNAAGPHAGYTLKLSDGICFDKYGMGGVSVSGGKLSSGSIGTDDDCGSGVYQGSANSSVNVDHGKVIGRGNVYGRWLWVSHTATASMQYGNTYYDVTAYKRSSPIGGSV